MRAHRKRKIKSRKKQREVRAIRESEIFGLQSRHGVRPSIEAKRIENGSRAAHLVLHTGRHYCSSKSIAFSRSEYSSDNTSLAPSSVSNVACCSAEICASHQ